MTLTIHDVEQRSPEWYKARCGIVTASAIGKLITPKTIKVASNDESRGLIALLASERVTGHVEETATSFDMWRGIEAEPYARDLYGQHHAPVEECGFAVRDFGGFSIGYSPDGLVADGGLIEIKAPRQKGHLSTIVSDSVPLHYMAQLQTGLVVMEREWIDYVSYAGGMPLFVKRVLPDPRWKAAILAAAEQAEKDIAAMAATYQRATEGLPIAKRIDFNTVELRGIA